MPIRIEDGKHVRVNRCLPVFAAEKSEGEPDQLIFIFLLVEGSDENIADSFAGNGQREGQGVLVRHAPDLFLHCFQLAEIVDTLEVANRNLLGAASHQGRPLSCFHVWSPGIAISAQKCGAGETHRSTARVAPLSTSIKVRHGSKFINHEGPEGKRRFKPLKFPSCSFVSLVVIALPYPPCQPVQPIPRILPACYPRTGDEQDLETDYEAFVFDRPDRTGKRSATGGRSRHPGPRSHYLPVSRHKFKQAWPGRARTGAGSPRQKPQLAARRGPPRFCACARPRLRFGG